MGVTNKTYFAACCEYYGGLPIDTAAESESTLRNEGEFLAHFEPLSQDELLEFRAVARRVTSEKTTQPEERILASIAVPKMFWEIRRLLSEVRRLREEIEREGMKLQWREAYNCHSLNLPGGLGVGVNWTTDKNTSGYRVRFSGTDVGPLYKDLSEAKRAAVEVVRSILLDALQVLESEP